MFSSSLLPALTLLGAAIASPIARENDGWSVPSYINVTYQSPMNESLPSVFILATGGTIAGSGTSSTASGIYSAGAIGVEALVQGMSVLVCADYLLTI
jgi:L-asparaginase